MTVLPARRPALALSALALGGVLLLATPAAASAHVGAHADGATAGATSRVELSFSHGCDGASTTALRVDVPEGIDAVSPIVDGAWTISRTLGDNGIPTQIVYTATAPVEDGLKASVAMDVLFGAETGGTVVAFPVVQECEAGENAWTEIPAEGQDPHELEAPAPTVAVAEADANTADAHAAADHSTHDTDAAVAESADATPAALWLAAGAVVLSIVALSVALLTRRRA
ncbi:DUF1775 domain-containing protein [Microbacterium sp.]|uniref:DUF1775 domain-containing protein n=1 Tax=Microbacterium sp. TaxID=51671 RepID=UPI0037353321